MRPQLRVFFLFRKRRSRKRHIRRCGASPQQRPGSPHRWCRRSGPAPETQPASAGRRPPPPPGSPECNLERDETTAPNFYQRVFHFTVSCLHVSWSLRRNLVCDQCFFIVPCISMNAHDLEILQNSTTSWDTFLPES